MRSRFFSFMVVALCTEVLSKYENSWDSANLHCRSENNQPLDWWFIYKPPVDLYNGAEGKNYVFISSNDVHGDFVTAQKNINQQSMPFYTIKPLFRGTYVPHLASLMFTYQKQGEPAEETTANYLLADMMGGVWMGTTVRGYVPKGADRPYFSARELQRGQTMFCLNFDVESMDALGVLLRRARTQVSRTKVPAEMEFLVPTWRQLRDRDGTNNSDVQQLHLRTKAGMEVVILIARAGVRTALTDTFARRYGVVLDVYENAGVNASDHCNKSFNRREIRQISIKTPEASYVQYVNKSRDRGFFAVSSMRGGGGGGRGGGGHGGGGRGGEGRWACFGSSDREARRGAGGVLLCADNEAVWRALTNLKVADPTC